MQAYCIVRKLDELRELDVQVAEKVFSWQWRDCCSVKALLPEGFVMLDDLKLQMETYAELKADPIYYVPRYSTNTVDAWALAEEYLMTINPVETVGDGVEWKASSGYCEAVRPTAEEAICECALMTKEWLEDYD